MEKNGKNQKVRIRRKKVKKISFSHFEEKLQKSGGPDKAKRGKIRQISFYAILGKSVGLSMPKECKGRQKSVQAILEKNCENH